MEARVVEIAERIRALREICEFTMEEMAEALDVSPEEYRMCEEGKKDFNFTFLYKCADKFGVSCSPARIPAFPSTVLCARTRVWICAAARALPINTWGIA